MIRIEGRVVMGQHMQRPWGRNGLVDLKTSKEVSKAAAEDKNCLGGNRSCRTLLAVA